MSTGHHRFPTGDELPQVFGRYLLVQRLSRGGMGEIFLARHGLSGFEKLVVIKKVLPHLSEDEQFISRFVDEAQVAIKLQHAHIAQVFEVGRVEDEYFLSLEYIEGRDLRRTLSLLAERGQRMPVDLALLIARDVASGLSYAHRRTDEAGNSLELVHCDISPPNVMVSFEGETKVIDFGIAKSVMRATATDPKMGFGKFGYMAPEQLIRGGEVDFRTDIYANGVILFELLTGRRMYEVGESPDYRALARMVAKGQHPLPSHIDPALAPYDELVAVALRPTPEERYRTAGEFRDAIQHALVTVNPTVSPEKLGDFLRGLFGDELAEQRQAIARAEATDLEPWVIELTTQSSTTISYAVAHMPLVPEPEEAPPMAPPIRPTAPPPALPSGPDAQKTAMVSRARLARRSAGPRRRTLVGLAAAALLVSGTVLALMLTRGDSDPVANAEPAPAPAPSDIAGGADDAVDAIAMPADEMVSAETPVASAVDAGARVVAADDSPPTARPKPRRSKRKPKAKPKPKPAPTVDRGAVQRRFQQLTAEYTRFKKRFGSRLEKEWADLAHYATFAQQSDAKNRALDRRITSFRARMRKLQN